MKDARAGAVASRRQLRQRRAVRPGLAVLMLLAAAVPAARALDAPPRDSCEMSVTGNLRCRTASGAPLAAGRIVLRDAAGTIATASSTTYDGRRLTFAPPATPTSVGVEGTAGSLAFTFDPLPPGTGQVCLLLTSADATPWRSLVGLLERDDSAVAVLGTAGVDVGCPSSPRELNACVAPGGENGGAQRLMLFFGPPADVTSAMVRFNPAIAVGRPVPVLGKDAPEVKEGYLFVDLTEANAPEVLSIARRAGFSYVLIYVWTWTSSYGSYPIHHTNYPGGEESLRRVVEAAHQHGIRIGLHLLTSLVAKHDRLVQSPRPDHRLLVDDRATLAADISADATTMRVTTDLASFPTEGAFYGNRKAGFDVRVGDEIARCPVVVKGAEARLERCRRGVAGTRGAHPAGTPVLHLAERYNSYLADLRTSLGPEIAQRIATLVGGVGIDFLFFDAGEVNSANGPASWWVAQQQIETLARVRRPVLAEGSGLVPRLWPFMTRAVADDFAALAPLAYLDAHKLGHILGVMQRNRMPLELGWIGLLSGTPSYPATQPEHIGTHVARALSEDVPLSIRTRLAEMRDNPRIDWLLPALRAGNAIVSRGVLPGPVRDRLRGGEWIYLHDPEPTLGRIDASARRVLPGDGEVDLGRVPAGASDLLLRIDDVRRLRADDPIVLSGGSEPITLVEPAVDARNRGALAARMDLARQSPPGGGSAPGDLVPPSRPAVGLDLTTNRTMSVSYLLEDAPEDAACAVLNLQLEDGRKSYRDYLVDLEAGGRRSATIELGASADRVVRDLTPSASEYSFKASVYMFDLRDVRALNIRWMKTCKPGRTVRVERVAMLGEAAGTLEDLELQVGERRYELARRLGAGEALEVGAGGAVALCREKRCEALAALRSPFSARPGDALVLRAWGNAEFRVKTMPVVELVSLSGRDVVPRLRAADR